MAEAAAEGKEDRNTEASPAPAGPPGTLRDRYLVRSNQPLPELSMPNSEAFACEDKRDPGRRLYALICAPTMPPRVNVMRALKGVNIVGLQQMVEWGPMTWPPLGRQCMTVIYERPAGGRLMQNFKEPFPRIDEYVISKKLIEPMIAVMKDFGARGVTHRAIRPTNFFYMDEGAERLALGDCVSTPPAYDQALVFETIESGMCHPMARGSGTYSDDLYSLGVTVIFALLGRNPVASMDDETMLRTKIQDGSYSMLVRDERLPLPLIEVLRGLLLDDADQRWDLDALDMWVQGRRLSPLQQKQEKRAARGFPFQGREYFNCRELAAAMAKNWDLAVPPVLEGKLELWLRRAIEDKERAQAVADVVRMAVTATADKKAVTDVTLAKVLMMLDPAAPIRYKGFGSMPDGLGGALATAMAQKSDTRMVTEIIMREVPKLWFESQGERSLDYSSMESNYKEMRSYLTQSGMGFGIERCLYEMNDSLPCQSSLLGEEYVVELKDLLPALSSVGTKQGNAKRWPVDRHVAAFMGARARSDIDRNLTNIADQDPGQALMALFNLLAVFQYRLGPESLPGLAAWMGALAQPVIASYHSREKRKELEKEIPKLVRKGSIVEMYSLLDDPNSREKDSQEFAWAQAQYQAAEDEIKRVLTDEEDREKEADRIGKQTAAVTGILIGMVTVTIVVVLTVW